MEILGIGVPEIAFIVLIALILLGPKDMVAAGRTIGKGLRKFLTSPTWLALRRTGQELQNLPTKLVREAGLEELQDLQREVQKTTDQFKQADIKKTFDEAKIFDFSAGPTILPDNKPSPQPPAPAKPADEPATGSGESQTPKDQGQ